MCLGDVPVITVHEGVSHLVFYAQSAIAVISSRCFRKQHGKVSVFSYERQILKRRSTLRIRKHFARSCNSPTVTAVADRNNYYCLAGLEFSPLSCAAKQLVFSEHRGLTENENQISVSVPVWRD